MGGVEGEKAGDEKDGKSGSIKKRVDKERRIFLKNAQHGHLASASVSPFLR